MPAAAADEKPAQTVKQGQRYHDIGKIAVDEECREPRRFPGPVFFRSVSHDPLHCEGTKSEAAKEEPEGMEVDRVRGVAVETKCYPEENGNVHDIVAHYIQIMTQNSLL